MGVDVLTAKSVAALAARTDRYIVRDAKVSGLELRIHPDGTKTWSLRYRVLGQQRRLKLGVYDRMTLAKARTAANVELRKVDAGTDPQGERQAAKRAIERAKKDTIAALSESYIERHAKPHKKSWRDDQSMLRNEVLPAWKSRAVSSITRRDCRELIQKIADRPAPVYANRILSLLSRLFRFAVEEEVIQSSPAVHLPKPGAEASSRTDRDTKAYAADEVRTIWAATERLSAPLRAIYRLGLLTGQRPGEITGMQWSELDGAWWTIPGARTNWRACRRWTQSPAPSVGISASGSNPSRMQSFLRTFVGEKSRAMRCAIRWPPAWPDAALRSRTSRKYSTMRTARA
jgi:hypothetical protein